MSALDVTTAADFMIDDDVATAINVRPERFAGKTNVVVHINTRDNEVGLWQGNFGRDGHRAVIWFRPNEVVAADIATMALQAPVLRFGDVASTDLAERAL